MVSTAHSSRIYATPEFARAAIHHKLSYLGKTTKKLLGSHRELATFLTFEQLMPVLGQSLPVHLHLVLLLMQQRYQQFVLDG